MLRPTKILVPTDFSRFADKALRQALDIAQAYAAKLYLVHVVPGEFRSIKDDYTDVSLTEEILQHYEEKMIELCWFQWTPKLMYNTKTEVSV